MFGSTAPPHLERSLSAAPFLSVYSFTFYKIEMIANPQIIS